MPTRSDIIENYPMKKLPLFLLLATMLCDTMAGQSVVSSYLYVESNALSKYKIIAFTLKTPDDASVPWESDQIKPLLKVSDSKFLIKVDVPRQVMERVNELECTGIAKNSYGLFNWLKKKDRRTIKIPYGGVALNMIRLEIRSDPQGADVYMMPVRLWDKKFKDTDLEKSIDDMERYKVNTSTTNTFARIDQTVFKIIFYANGMFKTMIFGPKPLSIEPEQSVTMKF